MADIRQRPSNKDVVDPVIIHSIIVPRERVAPLSPTGATAVIHRGFDLLQCPNPNVFAFGFVRRPSRRITLSRRVEKTRSPPSRDRQSTSRQAAFHTRIPSRTDSPPACILDSPWDASRILAFLRDVSGRGHTLEVLDPIAGFADKSCLLVDLRARQTRYRRERVNHVFAVVPMFVLSVRWCFF